MVPAVSYLNCYYYNFTVQTHIYICFNHIYVLINCRYKRLHSVFRVKIRVTAVASYHHLMFIIQFNNFLYYSFVISES